MVVVVVGAPLGVEYVCVKESTRKRCTGACGFECQFGIFLLGMFSSFSNMCAILGSFRRYVRLLFVPAPTRDYLLASHVLQGNQGSVHGSHASLVPSTPCFGAGETGASPPSLSPAAGSCTVRHGA